MSKIKKNLLHMTIILFASASCSPQIQASPESIATVGWLEQIKIFPPNMLMHSKLDTGADSCSVHAEEMKEFERDGKKWVSFIISNQYGEHKRVERRIIKMTRIKNKGGGLHKRPVVRFGICLGNKYENVECNLVDRSHFEYPVLLGRNFLSGNVAVNSSESYVTTPKCK
jgi:hypothetical protein